MKLSEAARHLIVPEGIESTGWPSIAEQLNIMDWPLDEWQQGIGQVAFAKRADGSYAAGVSGVVVSIPRQVGKTYMVAGFVFAVCLTTPGLRVIWSAHHSRTHQETFQELAQLAERPGPVSTVVQNVRRANGEESIVFKNGSRIMFGAREHGFGRGIPNIGVAVFDEAQIMTQKALDAVVPTLNTATNPLMFMMGTPPRPGDPGEAFTQKRNDALEGDDPDLFYVEMSADPDGRPNDREQWKKANPAFASGRVHASAMKRMLKALSADSFRREALGVWDVRTAGRRAFPVGVWGDAVTVGPPVDGVVSFGVKFAADGSHVAVGAALKPENGPIVIEGIRQAPMTVGTQWVVDFLVERAERAAAIVVDGRSGVGFLVERLRAEGVPAKAIITPTAEQAVTAHAMLLGGLVEGSTTHTAQPELDAQADDAIRRKIGNQGGFGWDAGTEGETVALLDAVTMAHYGAATTKRRPGRKQRFF